MVADNNKILVVDDEPAVLNVFSQAFSRVGYTSITANSAEAALDILNDTNIHVMFLDLNLPGMSGAELCREIRKRRGSAPVVYAVTGYSSLYELTDCREAGFDDYFTKPVGLKILIKAAADGFDKIHRSEQSEQPH
jgi:DNA-binding response OmpR family regulator